MGAEKCIHRTLGLSLILWLSVFLVYAQPRAVEAEDPAKVTQKLSVAESTYEVIVGHIKKEAYDKAFVEVKTLLDLKLPPKYDPTMIEAVARIAYKFSEKKQFKLAHATVGEATKQFGHRDDNNITLLKIKGLIYKDEGNEYKAIEIFKEVRDLELKRLNK